MSLTVFAASLGFFASQYFANAASSADGCGAGCAIVHASANAETATPSRIALQT
jgi:hypothetical protein